MSKKILVVDDEKSILEALEGILSDEGFSPLCAESAEEMGLEATTVEQRWYGPDNVNTRLLLRFDQQLADDK